MGMFTVYDILIGNPGFLDYKETDKKLFEWNEEVRAVLKNGFISEVGYYDGEGHIYLHKKGLFSFFQRAESYTVIDDTMIDFYDADGFLISDTVYNLLIEHKNYKKCIENKNLYELLNKFILKKDYKLDTNLGGMQDVCISYKEVKKKVWMLTDPILKTKDGKRNKKRIEKIINNFFIISCKL